MSSSLRIQTSFEPFSAHNTAASFPHTLTSPRPEKKQKMGIASTYRLAHRARGKLSHEASRGDHDLRLLVGHANLLDTLMLELQEAEHAETVYYSSPSLPAVTEEEPRRVQWTDNLVEQHRLDASDDDSDDSASDSEEEIEEEVKTFTSTIRRQRSASPPPKIHVYDDDDMEEDMADDDEYDLGLSLTRTRSHSPTAADLAVPELDHDSSDESDDESGPSSPEGTDLDSQNIIVKDFAAVAAMVHSQSRQLQKDVVEEMDLGDDYFLHAPQDQRGPMVAAY